MLVKHSIERTNNVQELREQAVQCIDRARMAGSASERKLYLRLALRWLEIAISMEFRHNRAERDAEAAASIIRLGAPVTGLPNNPIGAVYPSLVGGRCVSRHFTIRVACRACAGPIILRRSKTPHIDAD